MTVRIERTLAVDAPPELVWAFIADPARRADAISVVESFEERGGGGDAGGGGAGDGSDREAPETVWHVALPVVPATVPVRTVEEAREPPRFVRFVGRSRAFRVVGEHTLTPADGGTRLASEFVVEGRLPGVERFFERRLGDELDSLAAALRAYVAAEADAREG